ncbi:MAG: chemotaxis protein [Campylobacterales bacterium]|nr:chemotaxis protein [Campylobacterales bacterium]
MTQEDLDSMMASDIEIDEEIAENPDNEDFGEAAEDFKVSPEQKWPPPPPTQEHKVVHQLDEVTKDSEENAGQIFDVLEEVSNGAMDVEDGAGKISDDIESIKETFSKLSESFPNIETFKEQIAKCENIIANSSKLTDVAQNLNDQSMMAMDAMQYQDIHRQKIERVINVMRSLSKYMSSLFEGKIDDEKRVSSATHIAGDSTEDVVDEDDIEALIAAFGK